MTDTIMEIVRAIIIGLVIVVLLKTGQKKSLSKITGWWTFAAGFGLIFFGAIIDITDNFENLNKFIIVGDTAAQAFLEKFVGYLMGFFLLALGFLRWLPKLIEHEELILNKLEIKEERLRVFSVTMRTVQDIVNNFLNNLQLFRLEAEKKNALDPESLELMESIIQDTATKLRKLGKLDSIEVKQMVHSTGANYETRFPQNGVQAAGAPNNQHKGV